jgi:hypothetical protein
VRTLLDAVAFIDGVTRQPKVPIWKVATWLIIEHGDNAPMLVDDMLDVLGRLHADDRVITSWCEIGEAVRELLNDCSAR